MGQVQKKCTRTFLSEYIYTQLKLEVNKKTNFMEKLKDVEIKILYTQKIFNQNVLIMSYSWVVVLTCWDKSYFATCLVARNVLTKLL